MKKLGRFSAVAVGLSISLGSAHASAGGMEGGGGKGVLCGTTLQLLDFYEAEVIQQLTISRKYSDVDTNLKIYGTHMGAYLNQSPTDENNPVLQEMELNFVKQEIYPRFVDIQKGTRLSPTLDATLPAIPSNCQFVQIAIYANDGHIYRDREYWDMLSVQDQSALIMHEGMYHVARTQGIQTSDDTRKVVGLDFSENLPEPIFKPIWSASRTVSCGGPDFSTDPKPMTAIEFYAAEENRDGQTGMTLYFLVLNGISQVERVSIFVPQIGLWDFFKQGPLFVAMGSGNLFGDSWKIEFQNQINSSGPKLNYGINIRATKDNDASSAFSWIPCQINI